jgi:hypothetical protein
METKRFDEALLEAAAKDVRITLERVARALCAWLEDGDTVRTRHVWLLSVAGWLRVAFPYAPRKATGRTAVALLCGAEQGAKGLPKATLAVRELVARAGASLGSFAAARDFLEDCCRVDASTETERRIALEAGRRTAEARAAGLLAPSPRRRPPLPDGAQKVPRTIIAGADGTCFACRKPDVAGRRGRDGGEAKGRNANVMAVCEYGHVRRDGKPIPENGILYAATGCGGEQLGEELWRLSVQAGVLERRARVVFMSDGERELEEVFQEQFAAIPGVIRVLDAMHACQYVDAVAKALEPDADKAPKTSRRLRRRLARSGWNAFLESFHAIFGGNAESRLHGDNLKAWNYLDSRKTMMDYGNLRRRHIPIGSGMLECGCKLVIGSRLKGPGMHWRFNNGLHIAALCAALRSHLQICA